MSNITNFPAKPPKLAEMTSTAIEHRIELGRWAENLQGAMLTPAVSNRINEEIRYVLDQTCTPNFISTSLARLMSCYPMRASDTQGAINAYIEVMMEELEGFPPPVLNEVLPEFGRTHPFRPSVAEVVIACQQEVNRLTVLRHGLNRMERHRQEQKAKAAEDEKRKADADKRAADQDARAVRMFGALGVKPGDIAGAERTYLMLPGGRGLSPWMTWKRLVLAAEWPEWLAAAMVKAGVFGLAELASQRGQACFNDLADIQSMLLNGNFEGARGLLQKVQSRPIEVQDVYPDRPGIVSPAVVKLAMPFLDLLRDPSEKIIDPQPATSAA